MIVTSHDVCDPCPAPRSITPPRRNGWPFPWLAPVSLVRAGMRMLLLCVPAGGFEQKKEKTVISKPAIGSSGLGRTDLIP